MTNKTIKIAVLISILLINSFSEVLAQNGTTILRKGKKIVIKQSNSTKIIKYKRQWFMERSAILCINLTRIFTLHPPLIGIGTFKLHRGAYSHALDMATNNYCDHRGFTKRGEEFNFRGENVAQGYRNGFHFYWGWLNSKGHRENMLSYGYFFTSIGICKKIIVEKSYRKGKLIERNRKVDRYATNVFR